MRPNVSRAIAYVAVLGSAMVGVYLVTRRGTAVGTTAAGHDHGAVPQGASIKSVSLSEADARRIGVTFATVIRGALATEVRTVGQVTLDETRLHAISLKIDGYAERLFVNATGERVAAGQPLLTVYSPMLVAAQEELLLAKRLQRDVAGADDATRARANELAASARRRLQYWDVPDREIADIERADEARKSLTLRSSATGYVIEKNVLAGQKVMAGDVLYKVADLATVWVEGEVFEQDLSSVRVGLRVQADFQSLPGEHRAGRISYVYPTLDPDTRTVRVRIVLSNDELRLKPGMYATIRIAGVQRNDVLTVPRSAVLSTGERSIVFVRETNGRLAPREVALGATSEDRVEVLRGVSAGETVVASGTFLVDAESNLSASLGGMGDMPGMEMTTPPKPLDEQRPAKPRTP